MGGENGDKGRTFVVRVGLLAVVLIPVVYGLILGTFWLRDHIPKWAFWSAALAFLTTIETIYPFAVFATLVLGLSSVFWLVHSRSRERRASHGRRLLGSISLLFAFGVAESATAVWQHFTHRTTAMPIGGFRGGRPGRAPARPFERTSNRPSTPTEVRPPVEFPDPPGDRDVDVVTVGESSAEGVPFQKWLSIDRIVAWQLQQIIPHRSIRLTSLASSGETLEDQHKRLRDLRRRPDVLIVYCGHNEFKARFSANDTPFYYFTDDLPTTPQLLQQRLEGLSPLCGLIAESAEKCRISIPPSSETTRDLIDVPVYSSTEYTTLLVDFQRRLEAMVSYAELVGAIPILIVPAANDAGFEPNRSVLPADMPRSERELFRTAFLGARRLEEHNPRGAISRYRELIKSQPEFAETHYRLASLLVLAGSPELAYPHFVAARDRDGYPMRCLTSFQDAYRTVAARHGCVVIDSQAYFHKIGRDGLLDDELFQDMMHPSLRGYIALSQAVLHALKTIGAFGWPADVPSPVIDPARCAAHFGLDEKTWQHLCQWQKGFNDLVIPLRQDRTMRIQKRDEGLAAVQRLREGIAPEALGLPNVGIPAPVPIVSFGANKSTDSSGASVP
jgi:lysophospholipase L1-like esterase